MTAFPSVTVTVDDFLEMREQIHSLVAQWRVSLLSSFRSMVRAQLDIPVGVEPLALAVGSYFGCSTCGHNAPFPAILQHNCLNSRPKMRISPGYDVGCDVNDEDNMLFAEVMQTLLPHFKLPLIEWIPTIYESRANILPDIVTACGLDPAVATEAEVQQAEARLMCKICTAQGASIQFVYSWRGAVSLFALLRLFFVHSLHVYFTAQPCRGARVP